jgi:hypothetical protein
MIASAEKKTQSNDPSQHSSDLLITINTKKEMGAFYKEHFYNRVKS